MLKTAHMQGLKFAHSVTETGQSSLAYPMGLVQSKFAAVKYMNLLKRTYASHAIQADHLHHAISAGTNESYIVHHARTLPHACMMSSRLQWLSLYPSFNATHTLVLE